MSVSEAGARRSEFGDPRTEDRGRRTEDRSRRSAASEAACALGNPQSQVSGQSSVVSNPPSSVISRPILHVALLTGGGDRPYAIGMAEALTAAGARVDFIGSDDHCVPELLSNPRLNFLNLRGDQRSEASSTAKALRVFTYYLRLLGYATTAQPKLFHILWNNRLQFFDRVVLMLYYKLLGKKIVLTAHNVNAGKRDSNDSWFNRASLKAQYSLSDHIFVHTPEMKSELIADFGLSPDKVTVIPFGINNTVPNTRLSRTEARQLLGITNGDRVLLFFGNIAPYKGLEYLIDAFTQLLSKDGSYRLLIVGRLKGSESYWDQIEARMGCSDLRSRILEKIEFVPDEETEVYFKAADVLILPYTCVFQSGVLFLGYSFGLPAIAADVGDLKEEIIEGKTGFIFEPRNSTALGAQIDSYFKSELFYDLEDTRTKIQKYANERYSWEKVARITTGVYQDLLGSVS